jgi:His-Xaa-Ser system protein HxsD
MKKKRGGSSIDNMEINAGENYLLVSVNPKIYNLDIVYYATYVLMERAYVLIGGDPGKEIIVELRPKDDIELETLGREFNNELLNYAVYMKQSARNQGLREAILRRVLMTNLAPAECGEPKDPIADPEGIARPWRGEHGKKKGKGQGR